MANAPFARPQGALADTVWEEEEYDEREEEGDEEEEGSGRWLMSGRPFWWSSGTDVRSKVRFL